MVMQIGDTVTVIEPDETTFTGRIVEMSEDAAEIALDAGGYIELPLYLIDDGGDND